METRQVTVSVDASKNGLGAVLLQECQPVAFGSESLTQTQQHYAQIEKELMAVMYGLEHFNYYTYGRIATGQTDHKPILGLSKKPYNTISPCLQCICKELLPAPGNRSNKRRDREEDLATTEEKKL
ncbi:retrovirus-related Pol polyprotein from transposon 17.6 [Trichonephila clavipes]|nr:retrovirus-related Pol polyprotein from transposon 17.6 [Trichonephila clavipes]